jgi:hypothetical protein
LACIVAFACLLAAPAFAEALPAPAPESLLRGIESGGVEAQSVPSRRIPSGAVAGAHARVAPPNSRPYGRSYGEWIKVW